MNVSQDGLELVKRLEGLRLEPYLCQAGVLTIGYGHTGDVKEGHRITQHQADAILEHDIAEFEATVGEDFPEHGTQNQFDALVSFTFNVGSAAYRRSTLRKLFLAGDVDGAAEQFGKWVYGGGKKLPGLVKRRAAEQKLFKGTK